MLFSVPLLEPTESAAVVPEVSSNVQCDTSPALELLAAKPITAKLTIKDLYIRNLQVVKNGKETSFGVDTDRLSPLDVQRKNGRCNRAFRFRLTDQ